MNRMTNKTESPALPTTLPPYHLMINRREYLIPPPPNCPLPPRPLLKKKEKVSEEKEASFFLYGIETCVNDDCVIIYRENEIPDLKNVEVEEEVNCVNNSKYTYRYTLNLKNTDAEVILNLYEDGHYADTVIERKVIGDALIEVDFQGNIIVTQDFTEYSTRWAGEASEESIDLYLNKGEYLNKVRIGLDKYLYNDIQSLILPYLASVECDNLY